MALGSGRVHTANEVTQLADDKRLEMAPNPLYSPDLALYNFDLFGYIKGPLRAISFDAGDQLLHAITAFFESIRPEILTSVFDELRDRVARCCVSCGTLVEYQVRIKTP
jgi:hypothetical protein